jgi:hypothetical protein
MEGCQDCSPYSFICTHFKGDDMKKNHNFGLLIFILSLIVLTLACGLGGGSEPTQVPAVAEPTAVPAEPTEVPAEPTMAPEPTEEPTAEPMQEEPTEAVSQPESAAPSDDLVIDTVNGYRDDLGSLHIIGLVTNNSDRAVDNVEVEIEIFDANDNSLYVETTLISLYKLAPTETSPFSYWVFDDLPDADHYVATIVGQSVAEFERAEVSLEGVMLVVDDSGDLHITGNLVNQSDTPVEVSSLAAATFDENGELYTADAHSVIIRHLDPGEDGPFRVTMTGPEGGSANITEYEVYVDAVVADPAEVFNINFSETHHNYVDAYNSFHLVGEVTNSDNEFLTISLVAGIYDVDGNVIDAATTDIPTFSIAPGETLPYDFQYWGPLNYKSGIIDAASSYTVQWDPYWTWTSTAEYNDLSTQNDQNEVSSYQVTFTGEVINDSGIEVDGATIIVSLYSKETGELTATGYGGIYEPIAPNATAEYTVWIDIPEDFDIDTVEYVIIARGDLP